MDIRRYEPADYDAVLALWRACAGATRLVDRGCLRAHLMILQGNEQAVPFYESVGWSILPVLSMSKNLVVYRLRRAWPNARGATHFVLDPLDFLRRLAALVSFPYAHQTRYHGIFANRSRARRLLLPPPRREDLPGTETGGGAAVPLHGDAPTRSQESLCASDRPPRSRAPWAQLLRRVLHVDALSCPRCSTHLRAVPMVVLAVLTDPEVVGRILRHLGLPAIAAPLAPARRVSGQASVGPYASPL